MVSSLKWHTLEYDLVLIFRLFRKEILLMMNSFTNKRLPTMKTRNSFILFETKYVHHIIVTLKLNNCDH